MKRLLKKQMKKISEEPEIQAAKVVFMNLKRKKRLRLKDVQMLLSVQEK